MNKFILLTVLVILCGCSGQSTKNNPPILLGVQYVDDDNNIIQRDDLPKQIFINFPIIPGAVAGKVLTSGQYSTFAYVGEKFSIDVNELRSNVEPYATPLLATEFNSNITLTPKDTKLLRLGTFAYNPVSSEFLGPTGLMSFQSGGLQLFLVYFDRPASFTGFVKEGDIDIEYNIHLDKAGFSWLRAVKVSESKIIISKHDFQGDEVIMIKPEPKKENEI